VTGIKNSKIGNFAIFASGQGTNAIALIKKSFELSLRPAFVLVNKADSALLKTVPTYNLPCFLIETKKKGVDKEFEKEAQKLCQKFQVDWVFLAGFLKVLSEDFVNSFIAPEGHSKILNIHPSLLPKYPGLQGYKKAWENGDKLIGHTIHMVTPELDSGPIIYQREFSTRQFKDLNDVIEKNKEQENKSYQLVFESLVKNGVDSKTKKIPLI